MGKSNCGYLWYTTGGSTTAIDERWIDAYNAYFVGIDPFQGPAPVFEKKRNYQAENNLVEEF